MTKAPLCAFPQGRYSTATSPAVWIVEDEPAAAQLAADLCTSIGAEPSLFRSALPFLRAFREVKTPAAIVLDWRLEHELSAALFMATRHRFPELPVIYWTGSGASALPSMVRDDLHTCVVDKAHGSGPFERALRWALDLYAEAASPATGPQSRAQPAEERSQDPANPPNPHTEADPMMRDMFNVPKDPHPDEPDELTPDTLPLDDIERTHRAVEPQPGSGPEGGSTPAEESAEKDLDEPGAAGRTPRP